MFTRRAFIAFIIGARVASRMELDINRASKLGSSRFEEYAAGLQQGWLSVEEVRAMEGLTYKIQFDSAIKAFRIKRSDGLTQLSFITDEALGDPECMQFALRNSIKAMIERGNSWKPEKQLN